MVIVQPPPRPTDAADEVPLISGVTGGRWAGQDRKCAMRY